MSSPNKLEDDVGLSERHHLILLDLLPIILTEFSLPQNFFHILVGFISLSLLRFQPKFEIANSIFHHKIRTSIQYHEKKLQKNVNHKIFFSLINL